MTIVPQSSPRDDGVIGFTAHAVIFIDADPAWVLGQLPAGDLARPLSPPFLRALSAATGRRAGSIDLLCVSHRGRGLGRQLARAARHLVPADEPLWAQVAPGNATSVRAFLAADFAPAGAEILLAA